MALSQDEMRGITEAALQQRVIDLAQYTGWKVAHFRPAQTARGWRTPMQGDVGFPDLVLARSGQVIVAELKAQRGKVRPEQRVWLAALGAHGRLWRPDDWNDIQAELLTGHRPEED